MSEHQHDVQAGPPSSRHPHAWLIWVVAGIGGALLLIDHWAHIFGILPYLVLLACPLMHVFMHKGHRHGRHQEERKE